MNFLKKLTFVLFAGILFQNSVFAMNSEQERKCDLARKKLKDFICEGCSGDYVENGKTEEERLTILVEDFCRVVIASKEGQEVREIKVEDLVYEGETIAQFLAKNYCQEKCLRCVNKRNKMVFWKDELVFGYVINRDKNNKHKKNFFSFANNKGETYLSILLNRKLYYILLLNISQPQNHLPKNFFSYHDKYLLMRDPKLFDNLCLQYLEISKYKKCVNFCKFIESQELWESRFLKSMLKFLGKTIKCLEEEFDKDKRIVQKASEIRELRVFHNKFLKACSKFEQQGSTKKDMDRNMLKLCDLAIVTK